MREVGKSFSYSESLTSLTETCSRCRLGAERESLFVDDEGDCGNGIMLVGQCPGDVEREQGRPFVGPDRTIS